MNWVRLLDEIKDKFSLDSEYELAFHLQIPAPTLSQIRNGVRAPSIPVACKILDKGGYVFTRDMFLSLLPESARAAFLRSERKRMSSAFEFDRSEKQYQAILGGDGEVDWLKAIDTLKQLRDLPSDKEIAVVLKVAASAIGNARNGSRPLASNAKIILLTELGISLDAITLAKAVPPDFQEALAQGKLTLDFMHKNA